MKIETYRLIAKPKFFEYTFEYTPFWGCESPLSIRILECWIGSSPWGRINIGFIAAGCGVGVFFRVSYEQGKKRADIHAEECLHSEALAPALFYAATAATERPQVSRWALPVTFEWWASFLWYCRFPGLNPNPVQEYPASISSNDRIFSPWKQYHLDGYHFHIVGSFLENPPLNIPPWNTDMSVKKISAQIIKINDGSMIRV